MEDINGKNYTVEYVLLDIDSIKPYKNNPKDNNEEAVNEVVESIMRYGYQDRILVNENNVLIWGHTRLKAFKKIGVKKVEVRRVLDMPVDDQDALRLAHNKTQEYSQWIPENTDRELKDFADADYAASQFDIVDEGFKTRNFAITDEEIERVKDKLDNDFTEKTKANQEGMVGLPCPHCDRIFMMKIGDLKNKVKHTIAELGY